MLLFDVYVHPAQGYAAVKRGFSWPAFLFGIFWAGHRRLWSVVVAYLGVIVALSIGSPSSPSGGGLTTLYDMLGFGVSLFVGASGNGWCRRALERSGYRFVDSVRARSSHDAVDVLYGHGRSTGSAA